MVLLFLSITGFVLSAILLYFNARKLPASFFLSALFFLVSLYSFVQWVFYYSDSSILVGIFYMNFAFLAYLIGPLNYWYARSMLKDDFRLKRNDLWHLIPTVFMLATTLPYMFTSWTEKTRVASEIINDLYYLIIYKPTIIHQLLPNSIVYISRDSLILIYLLFTIPLFVKYFRQAKEKQVIFGQGYMIRWLIVFQFFFFILVAGHILVIGRAMFYDNPVLVYGASKVQALASLGLTGLLISPLFFPEILYGLPRIPNHYLNKENGARNHLDPKSRKLNGAFEHDYIRLIDEKVDQCLLEHQPYIKKNFNMTELSVMINIPVHHLAYFFREEKKLSFTNYRNQWRVEYAKTLIKEGKAKELTLEAIGLLSGFTNRNSFITAFKRNEGLSPHEYLSDLRMTAE